MLSEVSKLEKNKLTADSVWLLMLEITIPSVSEVIRIVSNTEDIRWNEHDWLAFPFEISEISESSNAEISQFQVKVSNARNILGEYIMQYDDFVKLYGYKAIDITLHVVNSKDLDNLTPVISHNLLLTSPQVTNEEVVFTLSARDLYRVKIPIYTMLPNACRFKFRDKFCKYVGDEKKCNKTLKRCRELNNSTNYGGFPAIGNKGVNV